MGPDVIENLVICFANRVSLEFASLNEITHKTMLKALRQMMSELSKWLSDLGLSEADMISIHDAAMRENGMLAKIVIDRKGIAIPGVSPASATADAAPVMAWVRSPEFSGELLKQPEPTTEELAQFLDGCKNGLARLRQLQIDSSEGGPRQKRGKGPKMIDDPTRREDIRKVIKSRRDSGRKLKDIFERLALTHDVSPSTIKRIWLEKPPKRDAEE